MNEIYGAWVEDVEVKPARAAFAAAGLPANARVEIVVQGIENNS
jgi:enamine deaminase RidA (YjgF/YER057c/UK114 family)